MKENVEAIILPKKNNKTDEKKEEVKAFNINEALEAIPDGLFKEGFKSFLKRFGDVKSQKEFDTIYQIFGG